MQNLKNFKVPVGFRGRTALFVQLWWVVQSTLFRCSPQISYGFRNFLLKIFGANVGRGVIVRPSATFTYPWKVRIGDNSWIGDNVVVYSLGEVIIGSNSVVSQNSYLCAGDHDYSSPDFAIRGQSIVIGSGVWVASDVFIAPGVTIADGAVIGARSSVFKDMPRNMICYGYPCRPVKNRVFHI